MIQAIQTEYKGYLMRSRLEARWAVFFDALGIEWEYEKEGFDFCGYKYLPDFWLPKLSCFVEVKPAEPNEEYQEMLAAFSKESQHWVDLICGEPGKHDFYAFRDGKRSDKFIVIGRCGMCGRYGFCSLDNDEELRSLTGSNFTGHCYACDGHFTDGWESYYVDAIKKARSARFEHGEHP